MSDGSQILETMRNLTIRHKQERIALVVAAIRSSASVVEAAKRLGIDRGGLYRELRDAGISAHSIKSELKRGLFEDTLP